MRSQPMVIQGRLKLRNFAADYCAGLKKKPTRKRAEALAEKIGELQKLLYADGKLALLLVFQGLDASGKDGAIRGVLRHTNPAGVQTAYFKVPTPDEAAHDFLWRVHKCVPARGMIGVFNRSHYEGVLAERLVHRLSKRIVRDRFRQIVEFERMLVENGVVLLKFYLHLSRDEQARRFRERLKRPEKKWKFSSADLEVRRRWNEYLQAYEEMLAATSRPRARWHLIPADRKWYRDFVVARTVLAAIKGMKMKWPEPKEDLSKIRIK